MAHIILASHGGLAAGVLDSMTMVAGGAVDGIEVYSLQPGHSPNEFYDELKTRVSTSNEQFIILCDVKGGSVHTALYRLVEFPNVVIFSGVNLGLALEIGLTAREGITSEQAAALVESAREGVTVACGGVINESEDEEDEDF